MDLVSLEQVLKVLTSYWLCSRIMNFRFSFWM